jgi:ribosomal protein S18 acetylase RimI-like enzyme
MSDCINYAINSKMTYVLLEVSKDSIEAINLYKKFGFIEFENNKESIFMKHIL